ncbi:hypothetical protein PybrP1_004453 [[Pythium] brassicae (nom. inval.)]|nr:hypothetical protein PybrP1_004453 [[Pythium] brassicae (nom. inval.)]
MRPSNTSKPSPKRTLSCAGLDDDFDDIFRGDNSAPRYRDDGQDPQSEHPRQQQRKRLNSTGSLPSSSSFPGFPATPSGSASINNNSARLEPYRPVPRYSASPREDYLVRAFGSTALQLRTSDCDNDDNNDNNDSEGGDNSGARSVDFTHGAAARSRSSGAGDAYPEALEMRLFPSAPLLGLPPGRRYLPLQLQQDEFFPPSPAPTPVQLFAPRPPFFRPESSSNTNSNNNNNSSGYSDYSDSHFQQYPQQQQQQQHRRHYEQLYLPQLQPQHQKPLLISPEYEEKLQAHAGDDAVSSSPESPQSLGTSTYSQGAPVTPTEARAHSVEVAVSPTPVKWLRDEDERLRQAVARFGGKSWKLIAEALGNGRTDVQCLHRWNKVLKPGLIKGPWTPEEDRTLLGLIAQHGVGKVRWCDVALHLPGRIGKQCRERWCNHLDANIRKGQWTPEEDETVFRWQQTLGNKWSEIAKLLPGRTENAVKNRFNSAARRRWIARQAAMEQQGQVALEPAEIQEQQQQQQRQDEQQVAPGPEDSFQQNPNTEPPAHRSSAHRPSPFSTTTRQIAAPTISAAAVAAAAERTTLNMHSVPPPSSSSPMSSLMRLLPGVSLASASVPLACAPSFAFPGVTPSRRDPSLAPAVMLQPVPLPSRFQFPSSTLSPLLSSPTESDGDDSSEGESDGRRGLASPLHEVQRDSMEVNEEEEEVEDEDGEHEDDAVSMDDHMTKFLESVALDLDDIME